eukprot:gene35093-42504_t
MSNLCVYPIKLLVHTFLTLYRPCVYEGRYVDGEYHWVGRHTYRNGANYYGEWADGCKHGTGIMTHSNGNVYRGEYRYDRRH